MIKVAFCSEDEIHIDAHFAQSSKVIIYEFDLLAYWEVAAISFPNAENRGYPDQEEDKVNQRLKVVKDCSILYCTNIGGPAAARLIQKNIYPLKAEAGTLIEDAAQRLHYLLQKNPPRWLQKKGGGLGNAHLHSGVNS
ncbi:NifB/NifX family molybdenum-iron cluster-binding protein [Paradesulfitobacterium ferrireducens]|uniref:NifB/NifX family molybdenum-iron cluster-binding protein n=1 Tax=Paradesulfitobacterium ferrireducens TaxID=2816476 RepID=UPI001A8CA234|nr:NifB/NifX family molybdenum-iron cluster-binding protein [Paradesulfitobacterium ferrireducens]